MANFKTLREVWEEPTELTGHLSNGDGFITVLFVLFFTLLNWILGGFPRLEFSDIVQTASFESFLYVCVKRTQRRDTM